QAGQSGRGIEFAAKHAEAIYSLQARMDGMVKYMNQIKPAAAALGKTPRVFFGIQPILGGTEAEARSKLEALKHEFPIDAGVSGLSHFFGKNLGNDDLDRPLSHFETEASRGLLETFLDSMDGRMPT